VLVQARRRVAPREGEVGGVGGGVADGAERVAAEADGGAVLVRRGERDRVADIIPISQISRDERAEAAHATIDACVAYSFSEEAWKLDTR